MLLKSMYQSRGMYISAKEVAYCINKIAYQGDVALLNFPDEFKSSFDFIDGYDKPVKGRKFNWMKGGILELDKIITVSPYYAQELISGPDKGLELDNILRKTPVYGMDVKEWNPMTDKYTTFKFDVTIKSLFNYIPLFLIYFTGFIEQLFTVENRIISGFLMDSIAITTTYLKTKQLSSRLHINNFFLQIKRGSSTFKILDCCNIIYLDGFIENLNKCMASLKH